MSKQNTIKKLAGYKRDLSDDAGTLSTLTRRIEDLGDIYQKLIKTDRTSAVVDGIHALKEPDQWSDEDLTQATEYLQREIDALEAEIAAEEEAARRAAQEKLKVTTAGGGISGGGGTSRGF